MHRVIVVLNGRVQSIPMHDAEVTVWQRCPYCGSRHIRINCDGIDRRDRRRQPAVRISCDDCECGLDDVALDPYLPQYP